MAAATHVPSRYDHYREELFSPRTQKHPISHQPSLSVSYIKKSSLSSHYQQPPIQHFAMRDAQSNIIIHATIRTASNSNSTVQKFNTRVPHFPSVSSDTSSMKLVKNKIEPVNIPKIYQHDETVIKNENNLSLSDEKLATDEVADQFKDKKVCCRRSLLCAASILFAVLLLIGITAALVVVFMMSNSTTTVTTVSYTSGTTTTSVTVTTSTSTTTSTTAVLLRWNATGLTIAGSTAGTSGVTTALLTNPYNLVLDSSNALYITDYNGNRIQKWIVGAPNGTTVAGQANGASGASSTMLSHPIGVVLDSSNNMYFSDRGNQRIMFWANGAPSGSVYAGITGSSGSALNQFYNPSALVLNETTGTLYIADTYNHRIMCYLFNASSGTVVAGGNGQGTGPTQLYDPYDFILDSVTSSFIIVNYSAHNIVRWILGATSWTLLVGVTGTSGSTSTLLNNPLSIVLDPYRNMYVSDTTNHRIQLFLAGQSNGSTIAGITGSSGTNANQLNTPYWAILDSQLNLYVADTYNNRVQMFSRY